MQAQKNTRRKRKDPQSRDFTCKCGKSYLSYAAAYTHVKNKHNLNKDFLDDIGKPKRQKLPRGRPKQRSQIFSSLQIQELSIIEETILKMYQLLNQKFDKIILEGNNITSEEQMQKSFNQIKHKIPNHQFLKKYAIDSVHANDFLYNFNRHFTSNIGARVKLVITLLTNERIQKNIEELQTQSQFISTLRDYDLWEGENEVNELIYQTYIKWLKLKEK